MELRHVCITYSDSITEAQNNMLYVIQQNLKEKVKDLEYNVIIIDKSTDLSICVFVIHK